MLLPLTPAPPTLLPNAEVQERDTWKRKPQDAERGNAERLTPRKAPDGTRYAQFIPVVTPALHNCEEQSH